MAITIITKRLDVTYLKTYYNIIVSLKMAALIGALDTYTSRQIGENGNIEYSWSNNIRERIAQLSFQLTRTKDISYLAKQTEGILMDLKARNASGKILKAEYVEYMAILYKMIGHTRDIIDGKGEYTLSFMLLNSWSKIMGDELAMFALRQFVIFSDNNSDNNNDNIHPYGSWKDIKYLYKFFQDNSALSSNSSDNLVSYGIQLMNDQLRQDVDLTTSIGYNPSLAAKWVPREKSQFSDLFTRMAIHFFPNYLVTAKTESAQIKAISKAKMDYRKIISGLNRELDTVQIKQCANAWSQIDPENQTSITMHKQKKAFLNLKADGEQRSDLEDRIICANQFKEFVAKASRNECEIKGKRIGLNDFTKEALKLIHTGVKDGPEAQILNAQWVNNSLQTGALGKMIAMVDVSGSMNGDPLHAAIALGIRVAEKSMLGKRVLTFSALPTWVNLDGHDSFIDMVQHINQGEFGLNTNFFKALMLILDAIVANKMAAEDVEDMVLAIFSDMQIDEATDEEDNTMMGVIEARYSEAGIKVCGKPYKPPHILFWNLRSTSGFPTLSLQKNASMMSGFSPALLNLFCDEGLTALQSCSPWSLLIKALANDRYKVLDTKIREFIQ